MLQLDIFFKITRKYKFAKFRYKKVKKHAKFPLLILISVVKIQ